jgi:hypothetical protein
MRADEAPGKQGGAGRGVPFEGAPSPPAALAKGRAAA